MMKSTWFGALGKALRGGISLTLFFLGTTLAWPVWAQQSTDVPQSESENPLRQPTTSSPLIQHEDVTPPPLQPTPPPPAPTTAPAPSTSNDQKAALPPPTATPPRSVDRDDHSGVIMAAVVAPIIMGIGVAGTLLIWRHGCADDGGFCNHYTYDGHFERDCQGDRGEVAGMISVGVIAGGLALAMLTAGLVKHNRYKRRQRRFALGLPPSQSTAHLTSKIALGREEVSLGFNF